MTKAEKVARRIEEEAYNGTTANTDWDSEFDVKKAVAIIVAEFGLRTLKEEE